MSVLFECTDRAPVARTTGGELRGYTVKGVHHFMGVPYGKADRFLPGEPMIWEGVRNAFVRGDGCITESSGTKRTDYVPLLQGTVPCTESEDCLNLNIWTPSLDPASRLPVVVWIPGGGFHAGNANDSVATDGAVLSGQGKVVFVSVNHRISLLGFLDLSPFDGERYRNSANLGLSDLVLALRWIRENIAAFGGNPENVTLAGHSGGGCKQWALMQTPEADGLYHKCVMESAFSSNMVFPKRGDNGYRIVHRTLEKLGLKDSDVRELEAMDLRRLMAAYREAHDEDSAAYMEDGVYRYVGRTPLPNDYFAGYPFDCGLRPEAAKIPVITGSAIGESGWPKEPICDKREWRDIDRIRKICAIYGDHGREIIELWAKAYPGKDPLDLVSYETMFRRGVLRWCEEKEKAGAPCWNYLFALESPIFGGLPAHHGSEIPFLLHNVDRMPAAQIPGVSGEVERQMSGALIQFAWTGDPNHSGIPQWNQWTSEDPVTMIFDEKTRVGIGHDRKLLDLQDNLIPHRRFPI